MIPTTSLVPPAAGRFAVQDSEHYGRTPAGPPAGSFDTGPADSEVVG